MRPIDRGQLYHPPSPTEGWARPLALHQIEVEGENLYIHALDPPSTL